MATSCRVSEWIQSIASAPEAPYPDEEHRRHRDDQPRKRRKRTHDTRGDNSPDLFHTQPSLHTPPATEMALQSTPTRRPKRRNNDIGLEVDDRTPTQQQQRLRRPSPKKAKSVSKTRDYLLKLETPVYIEPWTADDFERRPGLQCMEQLYDQILENQWRRGLVPDEVRDCFTTVYRKAHRKPPHSDCFRKADPSMIADEDGLTAADYAKAEFASLRDIQREAAISKTLQRNEAGWNTHVYAPLLRQVFKRKEQQQPLSVRVEAVMTATMEGDSIPLKRSRDNQNAAMNDSALDDNDSMSGFCVTVTASSGSSAPTSVDQRGLFEQRLAHVQSRSDAKIVDYVLVMDLPKDDPLQKTISDLTTMVCMDSGRRHVNQTAYLPVQDSVIFGSIETKSELSAVDPLLQLGIWIAAWYKRMWFLRRELFATSVAGLNDEQLLLELRQREQQKRLTTVPVIVVVGHQWDLYFACFDAASSITLYGPIKMGCTESILEIYILVGCLQAVKEWVEATFKVAMEDWFMCDVSAGISPTGVSQLWLDPIHPVGL